MQARTGGNALDVELTELTELPGNQESGRRVGGEEASCL
jgi:hypothetical protein